MSRILVLDFGSQYNQLIVRRIRDMGVYAELRKADTPIEEIREFEPDGIVLSGGPSSVYDDKSPRPCPELWQCKLPVLGICYGMQVMVHDHGGNIEASKEREYGQAHLRGQLEDCPVLKDIKTEGAQVWMSHGDLITNLPEGFSTVSTTSSTPHAIIQNRDKNFYALQFHPEVNHSLIGDDVLKNFLFEVCDCDNDWKMGNYVDEAIEKVREIVGPDDRVLLGLSGGVDSSVIAALLDRALGDRVVCVFVDNGLLRLHEAEEVEAAFKGAHKLRFIKAEAEDIFLSRLKGVDEPETKRKIIGNTFIDVFDQKVRELGEFSWLAQGTIYPDVIESTSTHGSSVTIKSHHNVGGLPEKMNLKVLEPLRLLFKDEVRRLGLELGLPRELVMRHPFPGPGLAVRVLGEVTRENLDILRRVDHVYLDEIRKAGLYDEINQAFAVFLPVRSVGVMGDGRTYENVVALRAVTTNDFMTADWYRFPGDLLTRISNRIIGEVNGVNRVVYDITSKPPGTIEWE